MKIITVFSFWALLALTCSSLSLAQDSINNSLPKRWMLHLEQPGQIELRGMLELVETADGISGYVEGGPITIELNGENIELQIDSRDAGARRFDRILTGVISSSGTNGFAMNGTYVSTAPGSENMSALSWHAEPFMETAREGVPAPAPIDLSGIWSPAPGWDMRKYMMDTTAEAETWTQEYDPDMDQPPLRCLSPGIVQLFGYVYPVEIVHADDRIFLINEGYAQVREVYLDGREAPDFFPDSRLGFSVGHWEGSTLVVRTTKIKANIRDFRGEPFSNNAVVEERYSLSEDGQSLLGIMTLNDPESFNRPTIRRVIRQRTPDAVILPYECDPDSFFRKLHLDGELDEYWDRINKRL